jgi:hypothetical protein
MLDNRARRDDVMLQTRRALGVVYFSVPVSFCSIGRLWTALAGASSANLEWQLQQQLTRSTKEDVGRKGPKGPMRIDDLAIDPPTVTDLTRVVSTSGTIIHRFDYCFQQQ